MTVLYNGWPLAYLPNSPAALHLLTILSHHPQHIRAHLALPAKSFHPIPDNIEIYLRVTSQSDIGRLAWEQCSLPRIAQQLRCTLIHHTTSTPALFSNTPQIISPTEIMPGSMGSDRTIYNNRLASRIRVAAAQGGLTGIRQILWPSDLPTPQYKLPFQVIPPIAPALIQGKPEVAKGFLGLALPHEYLLYHGPTSEGHLRFLANAWSWAADIIGDGCPLLVLSSDTMEIAALDSLKAELNLEDRLQALPPLTLQEIYAVYQDCRAVFHPFEVSPWGGTVRLALANAKPVIGFETPALDALVGPAAYLVQKGGAEAFRLLGAALTTVVVEEEVADGLAKAARARAAQWDSVGFAQELERIYDEPSQSP